MMPFQVVGSAIEVSLKPSAWGAYEHRGGTMAEVTVDDEHLLLLDSDDMAMLVAR